MRPSPATSHDEDTTMKSILGDLYKKDHRYAMVRTRRARQLEREGWAAVDTYGEGTVIMSRPRKESKT